METDKFKQQLKKQIGFLLNSCKLFDAGQWDEAIRIATSIRVILHDTSASTSLLTHLDAKHINLFTTYIEPPREENDSGYIPVTGFAMGTINMGAKGEFGYGPTLDDFNPGISCELTVDEWWNQTIWNIDATSKLTRKGIVLAAANKDGGAHVDNELTPDYKTLANETWGTITISKGGEERKIAIDEMHLVAIRTMANELLKSPDFLNLLS